MITEQENKIRNQFYEEEGIKAYFGHINDGDNVVWKEDYVKWLESKLEIQNNNLMPRISHFIDENGNNVDLNASGINVRIKKDGTHEYFRSYGFAGRMELTPVKYI